MPKPTLTRDWLPELAARLRRIEPDSPRLWGRLTPVRMMRHLRRAIEISLGEAEVPDQGSLLPRPLARWVAFHLPWPKGKINAPAELTPEPEEDLVGEREQLLMALDRFLTTAEAHPERKTRSPIFGWMSMSAWRRFHRLHIEHHLRQFGV